MLRLTKPTRKSKPKLETLNYKYTRRDFSDRVKKEAYRNQSGNCWLCKKKLLPLKYCSFHHIKKYSDGGFSNLDNCAVMHYSCHWGKSSFHQIHGFNKSNVNVAGWALKILKMEMAMGIISRELYLNFIS